MYSKYKEKKYQIKQIENPTGKHRRCIFHDDGEPAFIQTFCSAYECVIPVGDLKKAKEYLQGNFNLSSFVVDCFVEGKNVFIYWEDNGSGSWQVINKRALEEKKDLIKTSRVIEELQKLIKLHGDCELLARDLSGSLENIKEIVVFKETTCKFFRIITTSDEEI